jgi:hypothetical protein
MLTDWDYTNVQWFDTLSEIYDNSSFNMMHVATELVQQLDLPIIEYNAEQSKFFKQHYMSNWRNVGATVKEIDVIRKAEGW